MKKGITAFAAMILLAQTSFAAAPPVGVANPLFFKKQGITVLSHQKGPGGLNVWKVERGGVRTLFYTTPDNTALISGVVWDAKTGANLSDSFITADMQAPSGQFSPDKTPDAIKGIDALTGIREGNGSEGKTLYVMFDPRCPHCHAAYKKTRQYVASGGTIKWIPVAVLGQPDDGARKVAGILQAPNPLQAFASAMAGKAAGAAPNAQTLKAISENEAYFWAAFERNPSAGSAGVPVAFFVTKQGAPQMVGGVDDDVLLNKIFTDIKK